MGNTLEKPPPEKMTSSEALSGERTEDPFANCVAPTEVTYGHVLGKEGLKTPLEPLLYAPVIGLMHCPELPATPLSPDE